MDGTAQEGKIREANMRLPEHQREALALRELEGFSYDEIATIMEINRSSVAQLISRARINLHDELHGNVLASVAAPSPECERALPLIAMRDDGQLDAASNDATWLDAHLADCGRCRLGVEVMQEAGASYRAWAPTAATPAESRSGRSSARRATAANKSDASPGAGRQGGLRRLVPLAAGLALLLLAGVATAVIAGDDRSTTPVDEAAGTGPRPSAAASGPTAKSTEAGKQKAGGAKKGKARTAAADGSGGEATSAPTPITTQAASESDPSGEPASGPSPQGKTAVEPTQRTSSPKPSSQSKPAPAPLPTSPSTSTSVPTVEEPPPTEDSPGKSKGHDPPGKPANRPPK